MTTCSWLGLTWSEFYTYGAGAGSNEIPSPTGVYTVAGVNQNGFIDWCTYFGALGVAILSMDHDPLGRLVVAGQTTVDLPIEIAPPSLAEQYPYGGSVDAFIAVFDNSEALLWATCYGMQGNDGGATVRATNNTFVLAGFSNSPNLPGAPGPSGAYHEPLVGGSDVFLAEFDMNGHLVWTTYLGGSGTEGVGSSQALDITPTTNNIYITGRTTSQDLDYRDGPGWYDDTPTDNGSYIAEFSGENRDLLWLTAVDGGTGFEDYTELVAIRVSPDLGVCVAGFGSYAIPYMNFPGVYSKSEIYPNEGTSLPNEDGVYIRFGSAHELLHGTYFGGDGGMSGDLIKSLSLLRNSAYLVGQTAKANNVNTFFPLYQAAFPAWWQPAW
ncbi:MAG: hypothetical protein IPP33_11765 [Flavobacteriales bacterium]|nr:hypothetical protein [Flavobacteriales bacterium]